MRFKPIVALALLLSACVSPGPSAGTRVLPAEEAVQGVAADAGHFYAIADRAIGKYRRTDGVRVARWSAPSGGHFKHLNAGFVRDGKLIVAHSNFPVRPDRSSVEFFDAGDLRHLRTHEFVDPPGSLTWIVPRGAGWLACFAHYARTSDTSRTRIVELDADFRILRSMPLAPELLARFGSASASCGAFGPDGVLHLSGHDAKELYRVRLPEGDGAVTLDSVIPFPGEGQGFAWDASGSGDLFGILRSRRQVVIVPAR